MDDQNSLTIEVVMVKHKPYATEYKLQAVQLAQTEGIRKTASNLGLNANLLGRWKREHEHGTSTARPVFTGRGHAALSEHEQDNQRLPRELEIARQERDILKKDGMSRPTPDAVPSNGLQDTGVKGPKGVGYEPECAYQHTIHRRI